MECNLGSVSLSTLRSVMNNFLRPLMTGACGLLAAVPVAAGTIDIDGSASGATITPQNAGSPGPSFSTTVGGLSLTVLWGGELVGIDLSGPTTDGKNGSGTANSWVPASKTDPRRVNSTVTFHSGSTENDMTSGSSVTAKAGEGQAGPNVEAAAVPEPWTWVMVGLG